MKSAIGFNDPIWFMGIVENESDPISQGRVQVRCFGIHPSAESNDVQTEDLPWAPVTNAGHGGTVIPTKGDWVWGVFLDGRDAQHPFVIGAIPGQNGQLPTSSGSSDPYTKPSFEAFENYGEPPMPKAQSGEDLETTQAVLQNASLHEYAPGGGANGESDGHSIKEPPVAFSTQPHRNFVLKSRNGNSFVQMSEGDGEEHILLSHESGSHIQIDANGNIKIKSFGDSYMISEGHQFEGGKGAKTLTVEGPYNLKAKSATIEVDGDMNQTVKGNYNLNVGGKFSLSVGQSFETAAQRISFEAVSEHINMKSAQKIKIDSGDNMSMKSGGDMYQDASGSIHAKSGGSSFLTSGGKTNITGSTIGITGNPSLEATTGGGSPADSSPESATSPKIAKPVSQNISASTFKTRTSTSPIGAGILDDSGEL